MTKITLVRVPELSGLDGNGVSRRDWDSCNGNDDCWGKSGAVCLVCLACLAPLVLKGAERMTKITLVRVPELSGLEGTGVSRRDWDSCNGNNCWSKSGAVCLVCLACLATVVLKELRGWQKSPWSVFQSFRALMVMVFQDGTETVAMAIIVGVEVEWYALFAWHVLHQLC